MAAAGAERAGGREGCPAEDGHFRFGCGASACACAVRACLREAEQQRAEEKKASEKASTNEIGVVVSFFSFSVRGPPNELRHAPPSTRCAAHKRPRAKKKETLASHGSLVSVPPFYTNTFSFQRDGPGRDVLHARLVRHEEAR